jgi:hypothetical protein
MDGAGAPAAIVVAAVTLATAALAGQVLIPARVDAADASQAPAAA